MANKKFKNKDYLTSQECLEIMMIVSLQQTICRMIDSWVERGATTTLEGKSLKMARTYISKFLESIFTRLSKEEIKKLNRKMEINTVRLYDKYELDSLNKKIESTYEKTVLDSDQYCLLCENIMDVNCKDCNKDYKSCDIYTLFDSTLAPEPSECKQNCKYSYESYGSK